MLYALCVFLCLILFALFSTSQGVLLTPLVEHYGLTESQQGLPNASVNIGCALALLTSLFVMGRMEKPKMMVLAIAATVIFILPLSLKPSFAILIALYLLVGIAVGYIDTLASSAMADLFKGRMAARMMGVLHSMFGISGIIAPLAAGAVMKAGVAWNHVYLLIAGTGVLMCLYVLPVGRGWIREDKGGKTGSLKLSREMLARFFGSREQVLILVTVLLYAFYFGGVTVWTERFIDKGMGNPAISAAALSAFWLAVTACRIGAPMLKTTPVRYIQISAVASAVIMAVGLTTNNAYLASGAIVLTGLLAGAVIPMILHLSCERFTENTLLATTAVLLCVYAGQALGPAVIGKMEAVWSIKSGMMICAAASLLSGLTAFGLKSGK